MNTQEIFDRGTNGWTTVKTAPARFARRTIALFSPGFTAFKNGRDRIGHRVEFALNLVSVLAVVLAVVNGLLTDHEFRLLGLRWITWLWAFRSTAWGAFVAMFLLYGFTSHRSLSDYASRWWPELLVCVFWFPSSSLWVNHLPQAVSLDAVLLIGTFGHVVRVANFVRKELRKLRTWEPLKQRRDAIGGQVESFLVLVSIATIGFVGMAQLIPDQHSVIPMFGVSWAKAESEFRLFTWSVFTVVFVFFGLTSNRTMRNYCRMWWLELVICIAWVPVPPDALVEVSRILPPFALLMIGLLAHVLRVCTWAHKRLFEHPHWAIVAVVIAFFSIGATALMIFEPTTFGSFSESFLTLYLTGVHAHGELHPTTFAGWCIFALDSTAGLIIIHLFTSEWVRRADRAILGQIDKIESVLEALARNQELQRQEMDQQGKVLAEVKRDQGLSQNVLDQLLASDKKLAEVHSNNALTVENIGTVMKTVRGIAQSNKRHRKRTRRFQQQLLARLDSATVVDSAVQD